jgi:hypothetical protein
MEVSPAVQQRISTALEHFRNQMRTSNKQYISRLIIGSNNVAGPRRMRNFAQAIYGGSISSQFKTPEEFIANPPPNSWLDHDGTWPAKPEVEIRDYVRKLTEKINEPFDKTDPEGTDMIVPEEYRAMLKECNGIWDVDFRRSGVVGINGTNCLDTNAPRCE